MDAANFTPKDEHPMSMRRKMEVPREAPRPRGVVLKSSYLGKTQEREQRIFGEASTALSTDTPSTSFSEEFFVTDPTQFGSTVQRLTGKSAQCADKKADHLIPEKCKESKIDEDAFKCASSLKKLEHLGSISQECLDCLVYCSIFPKDFEIDHDTLIQLWMAEGIINKEPLEDTGAFYLKVLSEHKEVISLLKEDYGTGKIWYKLNNGLEIPEEVLKRSKMTSVRLSSDDPTLTKDLKGSFMMTRALLLLSNHKAKIERIPYDFFISLQQLRALDLSKTKVLELPSSIGQVRCLCYLDLSETLVKRLPESIEFLQNLQTLKLLNCPHLVALPKTTRRLRSLRHLDLGSFCRIHYMPTGIGALTSLRTLSEFIVGKKSECQIGELENMYELGGKLCLSRLEMVDSLHQARKASLSNKHRLKKLELRWTDEIHHDSIRINHQIIDHLQPHTNLQDLRILCYGGSTLPSWISNPSCVNLTKITLFKCTNCLFLPSLGQLPSLESLSLIELIKVTTIDFHFCREKPVFTADTTADNDDQFVAFPALQNLEIKSMLSLEKWSDMGKVDFPCLKKLSIKDCPEVSALCKLTNMISLEYLELHQCTKLPSLPEGEPPSSLKMLVIKSCPALSLSFSTDKKQNWVKVQHSPSLLIFRRKEEEDIVLHP